MKTRFLPLLLTVVSLPLTAALCCYPREDVRPLVFDRSTLLHSWQLKRTRCLCRTTCPPATAGHTLQLLPDSSYRSTLPISIMPATGTWQVQGTTTLVLIGSAGTRQEFSLSDLQETNALLGVGDSLSMYMESATECRQLVFSRRP